MSFNPKMARYSSSDEDAAYEQKMKQEQEEIKSLRTQIETNQNKINSLVKDNEKLEKKLINLTIKKS